jgi:hypothetical protein
MVFGMRAGLQKYGWLLVVAATIGVYLWGPLWPHSLARYPLWRLPLFSVAVFLVAFYLRRSSSAGSIVLGITLIVAYFYLGEMVADLVRDTIRGELYPVWAYFGASFVIVSLHLPVIATFAVLEAVIAMLDRLNKPATIRQ